MIGLQRWGFCDFVIYIHRINRNFQKISTYWIVLVFLHPIDFWSVSESSAHLFRKSKSVLPQCSFFKQPQWTERSLYKPRISYLIWGQNNISTLLGKCWLRFDFNSNLSSVWEFAASVLIIPNCSPVKTTTWTLDPFLPFSLHCPWTSNYWLHKFIRCRLSDLSGIIVFRRESVSDGVNRDFHVQTDRIRAALSFLKEHNQFNRDIVISEEAMSVIF